MAAMIGREESSMGAMRDIVDTAIRITNPAALSPASAKPAPAG
jgi:hypothetical protein